MDIYILLVQIVSLFFAVRYGVCLHGKILHGHAVANIFIYYFAAATTLFVTATWLI